MVNKSNLIMKGIASATAGYPISFIMNLLMLPYLVHWIEWNWVVGTFLLGLPYFGASVMRIFLIDYTWERYEINIDPSFYIKNFITNFKV